MKTKFLIPTLLAACTFAIPALAAPFEGDLTVVAPGNYTITIQNEHYGPRVFLVTEQTRVNGHKGGFNHMKDLKPGHHVTGDFDIRPDGERIIKSIEVKGKARKFWRQ
ncbi:MAG TPA: hypothetical protein VHY22_11185 [Chthoniobacteraceae bacterium]|jgi:hypothetical protein|nr:hypothetical protein [Chthoniobacteraceae bacterium]